MPSGSDRSVADPGRGPTIPLLTLAALAASFVALHTLGDLRSAAAAYIGISVAATIALYVGVARSLRLGLRISPGLLLGGALLLRLLVLPLEPSLSDDGWRYLWDGRLVTNGISPYTAPPEDRSLRDFHDLLYDLQAYPGTNTVYPPGVQVLFAVAWETGMLFDAHPLASWYSWKVMLVILEGLALLLLMRLGHRLGRRRAYLLLYAWHPLVVVELAGQGHTDVLWVLALAGALYGALRVGRDATSRSAGGLLWITTGFLTRLFPVVLAPLWYRYLGGRRFIRGVVMSIPLLLLLIPLLEGGAFARYGAVATRFTNYYEFNGGIYYALKWVADAFGLAPSNRLAGGTAIVLMVTGIAIVWRQKLRKHDLARLTVLSLAATSIVIAFLAKAHVWYFVAPLFLVTLCDSRMSLPWLWLGLTAPMTYALYAAASGSEPVWVLLLEWGGAIALLFIPARLHYSLLLPYTSLDRSPRSAPSRGASP